MILIVLESFGLFVALLGAVQFGRWMRKRRTQPEDSGANAVADGAVFAVLGLLVAFTFTAAASQFNERRRLIVQQANALGTASLRLDVLAPEDRVLIRQRMAMWIDAVLKATNSIDDRKMLMESIAEGDRLQNETWRLAMAAVEKRGHPPLVLFVMAPLNEWIDLSSMRLAMDQLGPPPMVLPTLVVFSLIAAVLAGLNMSPDTQPSWTHQLAFAGVIALSIYVIMDFSRPRSGLFHLSAMDQTMVDLQRTLRAPATTSSAP